MGKKRREDPAHDVGDSMPGTVGDSEGTLHDRQGAPSFDPEPVEDPDVNNTNRDTSSTEKSDNESQNSTESEKTDDSTENTRMEYARRYGDSWPEERKRRFLREHDVTAQEMGWTLKE